MLKFKRKHRRQPNRLRTKWNVYSFSFVQNAFEISKPRVVFSFTLKRIKNYFFYCYLFKIPLNDKNALICVQIWLAYDSKILHGCWFLSKQYEPLILKNHCALNSPTGVASKCGEMHWLFVFKSAPFSFCSHMSLFHFTTPSIKNKSSTNLLQLTKNASFLHKLCHASCFDG